MTRGLLHGIGTGPGDPELLTLKAVRLIAEADVVFCPAGRPGRARTSAASHLAGKRVVELEMEMRGDREGALEEAAATVVREIGAGTGVFLTEGDPMLYSTFGLLASALRRMAPDLAVRQVPGVSSITAAAAEAGVCLGAGDSSLAILPGSAPTALLDDVLSTFDTSVVLKPSMAGGLADRLREMDLLDASVLVTEASRPDQTLLRGEDAAAAGPPYFSAWLVPGRLAAADKARVHFVGAGPGAARHLTRRALSLIRRCDLLVAADSLVAPEVIGLARGVVIETSSMPLEELMPPMIAAVRRGETVVRLHSGDPAIYGAISEQMALLRLAGCAYTVTPGVSSVFAAAAALGVELTEPDGSQTVVLTRQGKRVPTPESERLRDLAAHGSTLAIFLSANAAAEVQAELLEAGMAPETPAAIAYRVSWPEEVIERTTVGELAEAVRSRRLLRHTLILVGTALEPGWARSRLYDSGHAHVYRRRSPASAPALTGPLTVVALTQPGERVAQRLARSMPGTRVVVGGTELPQLFRAGAPLVAVMAVGAAVRLLAPELHDKSTEPPVVVVDDAGRFCVSLLGGRAAGANRLARWVASVLGARAVVTTAAEALQLPALDEALVQRGWRIEEPRRLAQLEAAVVNGEPIGFHGPGVEAPPGFGFVPVADLVDAGDAGSGLLVSDAVVEDLPGGWVLARPRRLVLGFGCSTDASTEEAVESVLAALVDAGLASAGIGSLATIDSRVRHPAVQRLAEVLGLEVVGYAAAELAQVAVPTGSEKVRAAVGTASVAEAAALLASGGRLLVPKRVGRAVTVAVAERPG